MNDPAKQPDDFQNRSDAFLEFLEFPAFTRHWEKLGLIDDDLIALQYALMDSPRQGAVVKRSRGLRKTRFAPPGWLKGNRGGLRILYVYFERFGFILLCSVYAKNEAGNIAPAVVKALDKTIAAVELAIEGRYGRR